MRMAVNGLSYFPLNCQLDEKFELIEAEFGLKGFAVVVKLLQRIYGEHGYYCEYTTEVELLFSRRLGFPVGDNSVSEIVKASLRRGIFSEELFDKYRILTSSGIQNRFVEAAKRRQKVTMKKEYLLIPVTDLPKNVYIFEDNVYISEKNADISSQRKVKESKGKERELESRAPFLYGRFENIELTEAEYNELTSTYENVKNLIDKLSAYKKSSGKVYKSDFATLLRWAEDDGWPKRKAMPYSEKEEETKRIPMPEEVRKQISGLFRPQ